MIAAVVLLALLTWQVVSHGPLARGDDHVDVVLLRLAARHRSARSAARVLADLGDVQVALPVLAAALVVSVRRLGRWCPAVWCAAAMAVTAAVVVPFKAAVARPAPGASVLAGHSGYFPSGHAATAAMAYGLAALALGPPLGSVAARRRLVAAVVPLNVAVGAGLVWCGYHRPLDVAASWCLSGVLLAATWWFTCWWGTRG